MSFHFGGRGPGHLVRSPLTGFVGSTGALTAPAFTVFNGSTYASSATGVLGAPVFQMTIPADLGEGDYVEEQIDTVNTFNSGGLLDEERVLQWDGSVFQLADETTFAPGNFSIDTGLTSSTTYYVRRRFRRTYGDDSIYSSWSSTVTVTTAAASSAVLSNTNGLNKSASVTVSGSPALTFAGASGNGTTEVRSSPEMASTKAQFEITLGASTSGGLEVGIDNGTMNLNSAGQPGVNDASGISIRFINSGQITVFWNSAGNSFDFSTTAGVVAALDTFTFEFDRTAHTMLCFRTRSGSTVQIGGTCSGLPTLSHYYVFGGSINATVSGTFNFGATTYAKTPGGGVASYWA